MSYDIRQQWLPKSKYPLKAPYAMTPKYVTIHNTWNDAPAKNEANFMLSNPKETGFHVAVDDVEVVELIPFNRNAWHAGDGLEGKGNRESIGIEICYSKSGGKRYEEAEANAIEYTAHVLVQLGLPPSAVKYHQEWSGKNCPHRILDEKRGAAFKRAIAERYEELKNPKPIVPQVVKPPASAVKIGSLITKQDVPAYARPEWGTQTGQVVRKGQTRHVYAVKNGWYQLFSGEWLPSQSGANFDYVPVKKSEPPRAEPPDVKPSLKRVIVDGKQVGAFSQQDSVLRGVSEALDGKAKNIRIEDV
ncbi:N-acetylmuramoyl-L-alanine amidase family protein [Exiguobacterium sp. AB2]|uniref:peptidoglycan recognition protein family protein n=1 Tax=Exiguobacterium sp. AB2 TaxID=1484479 RepID=UPI0004A8A6FB|nr:N-acetylmuramoyl-L-alanine amidase [Exiguobacterium sp. AB2]KDN58433.1 hypothetical protein DI14_04655 [Exiguobacterium sp. AB2]